MINILNLDHLVLTVKDIEETVKFYEKLGMKKEIFGKNTALEGIEALESWFNKIGTPRRLNQFGLDKSNISDIIENLSYQNDIGKDDLENILINAL